MKNNYDLAIIGAGPAGMSAALHAKELGLNFLVFERNEPFWTISELYPDEKHVLKHPPDAEIKGKLKFTTTTKKDLLKNWQNLTRDIPVTNEEVTDIKKTPSGFSIKTNAGRAYLAKFVILATGIQGQPRKLGIPGENHKNVKYHLKHPSNYLGKVCLVVGGGDTAAETALSLEKHAKKVHMSYRREAFFRLKQENLDALKKSNVNIIFKSQLKSIHGNDTLHITLDISGKEKPLDVDFVFVCIGSIPNYHFLEKIGIQLDERKRPKLKGLESNILGLFIVGDLATTPLLVHAINSGYEAVEIIKERLASN